MTERTHRHTADSVSDVFPMSGQCECPGCYASFGAVTESCRCGAERVFCQGMGQASEKQHLAHGFWQWEVNEDEG